MRATLRTAVACLVAFAAAGLAAWAGSTLDLLAATWVQGQLDPAQQAAWRSASWPGGTAVGIGLAFLAACLLAWCWQRRAAGVTLMASLASALVVVALKQLTSRDRPLPLLADGSFPSGHTASATVTWGLLALVVLPALTRSWPQLRGVIPLAVGLWLGLATAVGLARVLGGAHWPTDVLAGWAWAGAVLALAVHVAFPREATQPAL